MKKLLVFSLVLIAGCRWDDAVTPPVILPVNDGLGVPSAVMAVVNAPTGPVTNGPYSITVNVTPGATYSFQLTHINGSILNNKGFTATAAQMTITMDYSEVANGAYDLNLMDNTGRLLKVPVIVQH
jgi:hypothetical protein